MNKFLALLEVLALRAIILVLGIVLAQTSVSTWQLENLDYSFTSHTLFILVPLLWLALSRRSLSHYGITFANFKSDLRDAMSCFLPVALAGASLAFLDFTRWGGAMLESLIQIGALFWVTHTLTKKPDPNSGLLTIGLFVLLFGGYSLYQGSLPTLFRSLTSFVFYLIFVGFGEELLNRGYTLTRLNDAFGKPYDFKGVTWGWGTIIAAAFFGISHLLNGWDILTGEFQFLGWWAVWTFFGALVFSYIRERTGSIIAGAVVHGLPQALVYLFFQSF